MKKDKLDKIVDILFQEVGELRLVGFSGHEDSEGYHGLLDNGGKLVAYGSGMGRSGMGRSGMGRSGDFYITDNFPLLYTLKSSLDEDSFKYIINKVGNRLVKLYISNQEVEYSDYLGGSTYRFKYIK